MVELAAYRVYASTLSSIEHLPYVSLEKEMHIVLAFAIDYDERGKYTNGKFCPYFDTYNINDETIRAIKNKARSTTVKFFLSIGGHEYKFPFAVTSSDQSTSITNATESLKDIVKEYGFDGIDVYYEHIDFHAECQFVRSIQSAISELKSNSTISEASITVSCSRVKKCLRRSLQIAHN